MSRRPNAPYTDRIEEDGRVLVYEGHDVRPSPDVPDPKAIDQPLELSNGRLTDNGKFFAAAKTAREGGEAHEVHVYEKLRPNLWVFNGRFLLTDAWVEESGTRKVCKFKLHLMDETEGQETVLAHTRIIPPEVKVKVWERDQGRCTLCGGQENLHFDHIIPFSKGGSSLVAENIQILCARHNLQKHDRIG